MDKTAYLETIRDVEGSPQATPRPACLFWTLLVPNSYGVQYPGGDKIIYECDDVNVLPSFPYVAIFNIINLNIMFNFIQLINTVTNVFFVLIILEVGKWCGFPPVMSVWAGVVKTWGGRG